MLWGMPTMVELPDLESNAQLCRRMGLDFVEINMNLPMYQPENLKEAAELSQRCGIGFTIHLDENFAPADFNARVADAYFDTLRSTLCAAKEVGMPLINMHMSRGVHFKLPDRTVYLFDQYRERYLSRMRALREMCEAEIGGTELCVSIENTDGYLDFQKEAINLLLESNVFALTWDVGHSHTAKTDDVPFMLSHRERLKHFHIHDAKGGRCHLITGEGEIPLGERIEIARAQNARCVLETKTAAALETSVGWLRMRGMM